MRPQQIGFMGLLLAAGTLISATFGGAWVGSSDIAILNSMTVFKDANILGLWSISIPNVDFFFTGAKALMMMDFAFFAGQMQILQWFAYFVFGLMLMWGFFVIIIAVVQSAIGRT